MFCPNCGTEIKEKKTFCPKCGSPLGVEAVQEDTKTVEAAASTENVHENVIPPQGAPVPSKKGGKKEVYHRRYCGGCTDFDCSDDWYVWW